MIIILHSGEITIQTEVRYSDTPRLDTNKKPIVHGL